RQLVQELPGPPPDGWRAQGIGHFHEDPGRCQQGLAEDPRGFHGGGVEPVGGVQQGDVVERVGEDRGHGRGVPCAEWWWFPARSAGNSGCACAASAARERSQARVGASGSGGAVSAAATRTVTSRTPWGSSTPAGGRITWSAPTTARN